MATKEFCADLGRLATELQGIRVRGGFSASRFEDIALALTFAPTIPSEVPECERMALSRQACLKLGSRDKEITKERLRSSLERTCESYLKQPVEQFVAVTSFAMLLRCPFDFIRIRGCTLRMTTALPPNFDRSHVAKSREVRLATKDASLMVRIEVAARSAAHAMERAMEAADLVRGSWNLILQRDLWSESRSGVRRPFHAVPCGPIHTLHRPDGSAAAGELFWYEPGYLDPGPGVNLRQAERSRIAKEWRFIRQAVRASDFGERLESAIIRYCRALDEPDVEKAFVRLWGVLEFVTDTVGRDYGTTITRALHAFTTSDVDRHVLQVFRNFRNGSVHSGVGWATYSNVVQLHRYVIQVLTLALSYGEFFRDMEEFGRFLSLPNCKEELELGVAEAEREIELRRRALYWHRLGDEDREDPSTGGDA